MILGMFVFWDEAFVLNKKERRKIKDTDKIFFIFKL